MFFLLKWWVFILVNFEMVKKIKVKMGCTGKTPNVGFEKLEFFYFRYSK